MKRIASALAAVAVATLGTFAFATAASAATEPHYAEAPATAWDWVGAYSPDMEPGAATLSTVSCDGAVQNPELTKPDTSGDTVLYPPTSDGDTGTSIETPNLGLDVATGDKLTVGATFSNGASGAAGAVRMFVYDTTDADTLTTKPTFAGVTGNVDPTRSEYVWSGPGVGEITFTQAGTIGTFGLTYDASNDSEGTVTFSALRLVKADESEVLISLCAKPAPPTTETTTATEPATTTSTSAAATLPVTGASVGSLVVIAAVLVVGGAVLVLLRRRRA